MSSCEDNEFIMSATGGQVQILFNGRRKMGKAAYVHPSYAHPYLDMHLWRIDSQKDASVRASSNM